MQRCVKLTLTPTPVLKLISTDSINHFGLSPGHGKELLLEVLKSLRITEVQSSEEATEKIKRLIRQTFRISFLNIGLVF